MDFSANINPAGLSKKAARILNDFERIKFYIENYPEIYPRTLTEIISKRHRIDKKFITAGAGATGLIFDIIQLLKPGTVIIAEPSFAEYERAAAAAKSRIIHINTRVSDNFELRGKSISGLIEAVSVLAKNDIVFIANPSNPAGTVTSSRVLLEILKAVKKRGAFLAVDESFIDFCEEFSVAPAAGDFKNLIIIRSLTKFFAMPGERLGYVLADRRITDGLFRSLVPWKITSLAAALAEASLTDEEYAAKTLNTLNRLKKNLTAGLERLKAFKIIPGAANFLLVKIKPAGLDAAALQDYLIEYGLLIRHCGNYRGLNGKYFRISVRKKTENDYLLKTIRKFLKQNNV